MSKSKAYGCVVISGLLACVGMLFLSAGCSSAGDRQKVVFRKYPNLKLGFTTKNFLDYMPVSTENVKGLIDYAGRQGFAWIELRDPNAVLTLDECEEIADYAAGRNVEVGYAINAGLLDADFWEKFYRGLPNAAAFGGPGTLRAVAGGSEFLTDLNKKWWTPGELARLVANADKAGQIARDNGLHLVVENGTEPLRGDGETLFGLAEFFEKAGPNVGWQFDTANFFSGARVRTKPQDAKAFLEKNIARLRYIHLKTSQDGLAQPVLGDSDLDFDIVFSLMSKHAIPYVAIELHGTKNLDDVYKNQLKSIEYLQKQGFVSVQ